MRVSDAVTVFNKEWLEVSRDHKTLILMFFVVLLYPTFVFGFVKVLESKFKHDTVRDTFVRLQTTDDYVQNRFAGERKITLVKSQASVNEDLLRKRCDAVVIFPPDFSKAVADPKAPPPSVIVRTDVRRDNLMAQVRILEVLADIRDYFLNIRLQALNIPEEWRRDYVFKYTVTASDEERSATWIGQTFPIALIVTVLTATMYCALDVVTGERERGTLILLLVSAASRHSIMVGKLLSVATFGFLAAVVLLLCTFLLLQTGLVNVPEFGAMFAVKMKLETCFLIAPLLFPLVISLSAMAMTISSYARTFQQGQSYFVPYLLVIMILSMASALPSDQLPPLVSLLPAANISVCVKDIIEGHFNWPFLAATLISSSFYTYVLSKTALALLDREETLFNVQSAQRSPATLARCAVILFLLTFLFMFYLGQSLQSIDPIFGLWATQILVIALPAVLTVKALGQDMKSTLSLNKPLPSDIFRAVALGFVTMGIATAAALLQEYFLSTPESFAKMLLNSVLPPGKPYWLIFLTVAVLPGICEELLFRGALQGLLRKVIKPPYLFIVIGLLFGFFHFSAFRFLPTAILGMFLSVVVFRARSIFPGMVLHATHNSLALATVIFHVEATSPIGITAILAGLVAALLITLGRKEKNV